MGKVLFVDDEVMILNSLKRGLRKCDFECYYATGGKEALKILEKIDIDVIMSDMKMPEMTGLELLRSVGDKYPNIIKAIVSGYAQLPQLVATINQTSIFKYISKPYDLKHELIPIIYEAIEYAEYKKESVMKKAALESKNTAYQNIFKTMKIKADSKEQGYDLIRIFMQVVMNSTKDLVNDDTVEEAEKTCVLDQYKRFSENYLAEIRKHEMYFEPIRIINDVEYMLKRDGYEIQIERGIDQSSKLLYEGRGVHIKPIIVSLIEDLVEKSEVGTVKVIATEVGRENEKVNMIYIIEGSKRVFKSLIGSKYNLMMYKSLLNIFGGDLKIKIVEEKVDILLEVRLFITDEGEPHELSDS